MINQSVTTISRNTGKRRLQSLKLCTVLLPLLLIGCVPTPEEERLISAGHDMVPAITSGTCEQLTVGGMQPQLIPNETGLAPEHISVLNWNIYKANRDGWQEDLRTFGQGKDLVLLQEAHLDTEFKAGLDDLSGKGLHWNFNSAFTYKGAPSGVLIASWTSPTESCGLQEMEPLLGLPKSALISRYPIAGSTKRLMVANIHGVNFTLGTATYKKQFQALKQLLDDHHGPIILAGDFNNWSDKRSEVIEELTDSLGLEALSFEEDDRTTVFNNPIDHILYRGLEVVSNDVHRVESSDHNPITAVFRLQQPLLTQNLKE